MAAQSYYRITDGSDSNSELSEAASCKTLAKAINAVRNGTVRSIVVSGELNEASESGTDFFVRIIRSKKKTPREHMLLGCIKNKTYFYSSFAKAASNRSRSRLSSVRHRNNGNLYFSKILSFILITRRLGRFLKETFAVCGVKRHYKACICATASEKPPVTQIKL
jgi:hypothetical protein